MPPAVPAQEQQQNSTNVTVGPFAQDQPAEASLPRDTPKMSGFTQKQKAKVAECWHPLLEKLSKDNLVNEATYRSFVSASEYSQYPMGTKVTELFKNSFMRSPKQPSKPGSKKPASRVYKSVMTEANSQKCINFLNTHKKAFDSAEKQFSVPREVIVSLLFVETRLGEYIGKENAFWSLACMAAATTPDHVSDTLEKLPYDEEKHGKWLQTKLDDKSGWAYKELKALLTYCQKNQMNPTAMPGSVYGAIGLCQFMPTNISRFGADGDGDGIIDLFSVSDALHSIAKYLAGHGWKENLTAEQQHKILKRYNNLNIYANTILAMAEAVDAGGVTALAAKKKAEALASTR